MGARAEWIQSRPGVGPQCPVCGHKGGCLVAKSGEAAVCLRVQQGCAKRSDGTPIVAKSGMGWLHILSGKDAAAACKATGGKPAGGMSPKIHASEWRQIIREQQTRVDPARLDTLAAALGVKVKSLITLGIGWEGRNWSFPMYDGTFDSHGRPNPCGIRLRGVFANGDIFKGAMKGSRNGLFLPTDDGTYDVPDLSCLPTEWGLDDSPWLVVCPEGPTSTAAALDLGFRAIGRPNASACLINLRMMLQWPPKRPRQHVIILADRDSTKWTVGESPVPFWPGHEGAIATAKGILDVCASVRIVKPPKGSGKDLRDWLRSGLDWSTFAAAIHPQRYTEPFADDGLVTREWIDYKEKELRQWKAGLMRNSTRRK